MRLKKTYSTISPFLHVSLSEAPVNSKRLVINRIIMHTLAAVFLCLGNYPAHAASVIYEFTPTSGSASGQIEFASPPADITSGWMANDINDILSIEIDLPPLATVITNGAGGSSAPYTPIGSNTGQQIDFGFWYSNSCAALLGFCWNIGFSDAVGGDFISYNNFAGLHYEANGDWSVVPIPAALWLFGSALGLLGWIGRSRPD